mgnify:CR=1 FL=1
MHTQKSNPYAMIEDDWDSVIDNYGLDEENKFNRPDVKDNACLKIIKSKHLKEQPKIINPLSQ